MKTRPVSYTRNFTVFKDNFVPVNWGRGGAVDIANYEPNTWVGGTSSKTINISYRV